jgi:hypothetical protein
MIKFLTYPALTLSPVTVGVTAPDSWSLLRRVPIVNYWLPPVPKPTTISFAGSHVMSEFFITSDTPLELGVKFDYTSDNGYKFVGIQPLDRREDGSYRCSIDYWKKIAT